jgi:hypothetical protein
MKTLAIFDSDAATTGHRDPDVVENRSDWRMRFVYGHSDLLNTGEAAEDNPTQCVRRRFQKLESLRCESEFHLCCDVRVGDSVGEAIVRPGLAQIELQFEIHNKALPEPILVPHNPMMGMHDQASKKDHVGHCASRMVWDRQGLDGFEDVVNAQNRRPGGSSDEISGKRAADLSCLRRKQETIYKAFS